MLGYEFGERGLPHSPHAPLAPVEMMENRLLGVLVGLRIRGDGTGSAAAPIWACCRAQTWFGLGKENWDGVVGTGVAAYSGVAAAMGWFRVKVPLPPILSGFEIAGYGGPLAKVGARRHGLSSFFLSLYYIFGLGAKCGTF